MDPDTRSQLIALVIVALIVVIGAWWWRVRRPVRTFTATQIQWQPKMPSILTIQTGESLDPSFAQRQASLKIFVPSNPTDVASKAVQALLDYPFTIKSIDAASKLVVVGSVPAGIASLPAVTIPGTGSLRIKT
jgi:hypothetical protein